MQSDTSIPAELLAIAERLGFPTLETRSDRRDIREVAVWMVRDVHARSAAGRSRSDRSDARVLRAFSFSPIPEGVST